jgi:hypothetical protein
MIYIMNLRHPAFARREKRPFTKLWEWLENGEES